MPEDAVSSRKDASPGGPDALSSRIEALVVEWAEVIRTAARRYGLSHADLDEVRQDVRLRLWHALERVGDREVNASYGYRAASSAAIDLVRRHRLSRGGSTVTTAEGIAGTAADETLLATRLREALAVVPESRRAAVRLHLNGHSLADVASVLRWTPAQARNQVYRGLADLKRALQGAEGPAE
jgi:RNA polymerase sigma factor (sigma-70 family)